MFKKSKKNLYLILISFFALIAPSILTIACESQNNLFTNNNSSKNTDFYSKKYYRPFQFNEIKKFGKGQPVMTEGLGFNAYAYGLSFIWNVMRKLGFDIFQDKAQIFKDQPLGIKYYDKWDLDKNSSKYQSERKWNQSDFENNQKLDLYQENPEKILRIFEKLKTIQTTVKLKAELRGSGDSWFVEPLGIDYHINGWKLQRAGYQGYYAFWTESGKPGEKIFNIIDKKTQWSPWFKKYILPKVKKIFKDQKILKYTMPSYFYIIDGIKEKPKEAKIEEGNKVILITQVRNYDDSIKDFELILTGGLKLQKKIIRGKKWSFNSVFISHKNYVQGFQIIKNQVKIEEMKMLITAAIKNMHHYLNKNNNIIFDYIVHPTLIEMFRFIRKLKINEEKVLKKIHQAIEQLNNGSHNMFAVEIFARGVENVPLRYMPEGINGKGNYGIPKMPNNSKLGMLTGIANTLDMDNIISWAHTTKSGFADENGNKSKKDNEHFDPDKGKWFINGDKNKTNKVKRLGREIKPMGGIVERVKYQDWAIKYNNWVQATSENPENKIKEPIFNSYWNKNKKYLF